MILALGYAGPVMMGTNWYGAMSRPRGDGALVVAGEVVGGHAYLLTRYSKTRDAVWTPNSWGGEGQGWISRADLVRLLAEEGEACLALNRKTIASPLTRPPTRSRRGPCRPTPAGGSTADA